MSRITVRPKIKDGESLSGYLIRVSGLVGMKPQSLLKSIAEELSITKDKYNRVVDLAPKIDLLPNLFVKMELLSEMFGKSVSELENTSFLAVFEKCYDGIPDYKAASRLGLNKHNRCFCVECLREDRIYKLLWQVKEINTCDKHAIYLSEKCPVCGKMQPYFSDELAEYKCTYCDKLFMEFNEEKVTDFQLIINEKRKYEDWLFLLSRDVTLHKNFWDFDRKKSLTVISLFIAQFQEAIFQPNRVSFFKNYKINDMRRYINGYSMDSYTTINSLLSLVRFLKMDIKLIKSINVPDEYIESINLNEKELGHCTAPWCRYYNTNKMIFRVKSQRFDKISYSQRSVCTGCFMPYGYNRKSGNWEMKDNKIVQLLHNVKIMLEAGENRRAIMERLHTAYSTINYALAYLVNHNLISETYLCEMNLPNKPHDLLEKFNKLLMVDGTMLANAKAMFGWDSFQYYYYYTLPEVQQFLLLGVKKTKRLRYDVEGNRRKEITEVIEYLLKKNINITYENIMGKMKTKTDVIVRSNMQSIVSMSKEAQVSIRRERYFNESCVTIKNFIKNRDFDEGRLTYKLVYNSIGVSKEWVRKNIPLLVAFINEQVSQYNNNYYQNLIKMYEKKIENILIEGYRDGIELSNKDIYLKLDKSQKLFSANPELKEFIIQIKQKLYK